MAPVSQRTGRNLSMECCKLLAAFCVVFNHVAFPGELGGLVMCLGRFAVPMFFVISGYFNFRSGCGSIGRRMKHILLLNLVGTGVQIGWNFMSTMLYGRTFGEFLQTLHISVRQVMEWLILSMNPFGGHLWYLASIFGCYGILWLYVRSFGEREVPYRPLYLAGVLLAAVHFALGEFAQGLGMQVPYQLPRNTLFYGLPMFTLGIFLREHWEQLWRDFRLTPGKLVLMLLGGLVFSLGEWLAFGASEMHLGTVVVVIALMLLMSRYPQMGLRWEPARKLVSRFGAWSTGIYIVHMAVREYYMGLKQYGLYLEIGNREALLRPLIIAAASLLIAIIWDSTLCLIKRITKKA